MAQASTSTSDAGPSADHHAVVELGGALTSALVAFSDRGLIGLRAWGDFPIGSERDAWLASIAAEGASEGALPPAWHAVLAAFSVGEPADPADLPVDLRGPRFHVAVWRALLRVKRGSVRSYQGLAKDAGSPRAVRAVGQAMARNPLPIVVPCHRVIASGGALGGYTGGVARKRVLLGLEGVPVIGEQVQVGQLDLWG